jgi:hypothetical protein
MGGDDGNEQACFGDLNLLDLHAWWQREKRAPFHASPRLRENKGNE